MLLLVAVAGCGRDGVKVYHVENTDAANSAPSAVMPATMPDGLPAPDNRRQPQLQYILPANWQEKTPGQMRVASFAVTNSNGEMADVGVIPLPTGGSELALVNMWRGQMQLPALTNETSAETISVGNVSAKLFEIASDAPIIDGKFRARILVAELPRGETSWFFKMTGEESFVAAQKENFLQFLKSVSFAGNSAPSISAAPAMETQNANSLWTIPADWKSLPPSEFLLAEFSIEKDGANADVNVAELNGEGGGLAANINRWRAQLGLPTADETDFSKSISTLAISGGNATLVDLSGTNSKTGKPARLIGAVIPQNGRTWFYKLMGDPNVVAQQKDAFIKFVQSAKYPDAH
jgi:hypothetical protein